MDIATALTRAGVSSVLEPGDEGYETAVAGFDRSVLFAPDIVIDAQTPADVSIAIEVVADRGETLTVMGAGHGRLHGVRDGVAITLRHLDAVDVTVTDRTARVGAGSTWEPVLAATVPHGLPSLRLGARCRCGRLPPRRRARSPGEVRGVQQRPRPLLRHRDTCARAHHRLRRRPR